MGPAAPGLQPEQTSLRAPKRAIARGAGFVGATRAEYGPCRITYRQQQCYRDEDGAAACAAGRLYRIHRRRRVEHHDGIQHYALFIRDKSEEHTSELQSLM